MNLLLRGGGSQALLEGVLGLLFFWRGCGKRVVLGEGWGG